MTDRVSAFLVVLDKDIREDDAQSIIEAIKLLRGVVSVKPQGNVVDVAIAQERVRHELGMKLLHVIWPDVYKDA